METEHRLGVGRVRGAGLGHAAARKRARIEAWLDEQRRAHEATPEPRVRPRSLAARRRRNYYLSLLDDPGYG